MMLATLMIKQQCKCHYCGVMMTLKPGDSHRFKDTDATVEHLVDKWSSAGHVKNNGIKNLAAACFKCNNSIGSARNKIARSYYQTLINARGEKKAAASISSKELFKRFGAVPQHLFSAL